MGLHGYDNQHPLMRAIFVARGPAFPHTPGSLVEPFQNIEVYNIICDSLGLKPASNNGTIRLPLRPSGMHDGSVDVPEDIQDDPSLALPPPDGLIDSSKGASATLPPEVANLANRPDLMVPTEGVPPVSEATPSQIGPSSGSAASPSSEDEEVPETSTDGDEKGKHHTSWWSWVTGKIDAMKGWASSFFGSKDEQKAKDDNQNR
ncbi:hypothetical protein KC355_g17950 [Hortaea werneckii]|nr:hypothetical protein KC355_g17950 [Hortaea werneckii]